MTTATRPARAARAPRPADPLPTSADFLVVGGGIIGLTVALAMRRRHPDASVTLLEKEPAAGLHASGRNSGVLHAGFYYAADSWKARFTRDGNRRMAEYCRDRGLRLNVSGKIVVAAGPEDLPALDELARRARANGVPLDAVSAEDALRIEPRARTYERALYSPTTATVNPAEVVGALARDAAEAGVRLCLGAGYVSHQGTSVRTSTGRVHAGYLINAAGLYADRVARDYGFGERYDVLPFKGLYLDSAPGAPTFRTQVYPVPDLRQPFLGVHVTVAVDGTTKLGPTAIPAFWREHYGGFAGFRFGEMVDIMRRQAGLFARNEFGFRALAWEEVQKYRRGRIVELAGRLAAGVRPEHYPTWHAPGIRAQLYDRVAGRLEMDFRVEGDERSFHVLNAVSPAFTCALPFSEFVAERIDALLR